MPWKLPSSYPMSIRNIEFWYHIHFPVDWSRQRFNMILLVLLNILLDWFPLTCAHFVSPIDEFDILKHCVVVHLVNYTFESLLEAANCLVVKPVIAIHAGLNLAKFNCLTGSIICLFLANYPISCGELWMSFVNALAYWQTGYSIYNNSISDHWSLLAIQSNFMHVCMLSFLHNYLLNND